MKQYQQCLLGRNGRKLTAWIEQRGAKVGADVELLPSKEFWRVIAVFDLVMPENMLKEHQALNRHSLPSVDPIR